MRGNVLNCCTFEGETVFLSPGIAASPREPPLSWASCGNTTTNYLPAWFVVFFGGREGWRTELCKHSCNSKRRQQACPSLMSCIPKLSRSKERAFSSLLPHPPYPPVWLSALFLLFPHLPIETSAEEALGLRLHIAEASQKGTVLMTFRWPGPQPPCLAAPAWLLAK